MYPRETAWLGVDRDRAERCQAYGPSPDCCPMRRLLGSLCAAGLSLTTGVAAQSASTYLPIDHWAMPYVEHLIRASVIPDPDPLTRPLKLGSVVAELQGADTTRLPSAVRATIRQLLHELTPRGAPPYYRADLYVGASAGSQGRGDELHLSGASYGAYQAGMRLSAVFGPVAISSHPYTDRYLKVDPDYTGDKSTNPPGRFTDAYISLQQRYGELFVGALRRNWGPTGIAGLLTSSYPYSYDHLMARVGTRSLRVEVLTTQLDDMTDTTGTTFKRYWTSTRVIVRPWKWLTASIDNAALWYGPNRGFELRFLNPLTLAFITSVDDNLPDRQNTAMAGELRVALPRGVVLQGSFLLDACCDLLPDRLGATGVADVPLGAGTAARAWVTAVTAFAYRAPEGLQNSIMLRGVGLGRNFADYVEAGLTVSTMPVPMLTLAPQLVLLEQGEGDFRVPPPPEPVRGPLFFQGVIERTWRLGVLGQAQLGRRLDVAVNAGWNLIANSGHQPGVSRARFAGTASVQFQFGGPVHLPD